MMFVILDHKSFFAFFATLKRLQRGFYKKGRKNLINQSCEWLDYDDYCLCYSMDWLPPHSYNFCTSHPTIFL